jgi:phosphatidylethanolamine/phosphatidyl-N-methylethanolamine N-methyltransferase
MARDTFEFVKAALRRPMEVSTVFPTSKALAETLLNHANLASAEKIVELGTGTGAITKHLQKRLVNPQSYLGIELDEKMVEFMKTEFPKLRFEAGLAADLPRWVAPDSVDVVVSSLPWTVFSTETQLKTIQAIISCLKPGGSFVTYVLASVLYMPQGRSLIRLLRENFRDVQRSDIEWRNIPPAFVFRSLK